MNKEILKQLGYLFLILIIKTCLLPFRLVSFILLVAETVIKIVKNTINYLVNQIECETIKNKKDGKNK